MNQNAFSSRVLTSWIRHDPDAAIDYSMSLTDQGPKIQMGARLLAAPSLHDSGYSAHFADGD